MNRVKSQMDVARRSQLGLAWWVVLKSAGREGNSAARERRAGDEGGRWTDETGSGGARAPRTATMSRARVYCDVNETRPREYWDYETLNVAWGYGRIHELSGAVGCF